MELPDNVIKHYLREVYFISGSACGGKTTIAEYLSSKYGIALYNWDEKYGEHKAISDATHQPYMNRAHGSWEEHFMRPPSELAESVRGSINEQVEIAIVELISMAARGRIIVDGAFPCHILKRISSWDRAVFLMADMDAIRSDFFNRVDKQDMLRCVNGLRDPQKAMENIFRSIEHSLSREMAQVRASGFKWLPRTQRADWESIRAAVERHFRLTD